MYIKMILSPVQFGCDLFTPKYTPMFWRKQIVAKLLRV